MTYGFVFFLFLSALAFFVWVGSLVTLITIKNDNSAPPEKVQLRKKVKGLNIALICVIAFGVLIWYSFILGVAMIVLAVFCGIESVKLFKMNSQSSQQFGQQNYQQQSYTPPQQTQAAPQPQQQQPQARSCPNCGAQISADCYFCVHCGKKV